MLLSKRLIASYIFDWIVIIAIAAVGGGWNYLTPFHRPFSLVDLTISYPYQEHEKIPTWLLILVALIIPAAIVFLVSLIFVPGPTAKNAPKSLIWKRKLWEWNTGWMGLALSLATAFLITQGMKNLFGKPRPDLLSRCRPDAAAIHQHALSTAGATFNPTWVLVNSDICTNRDMSILNDGFKSFPSGHASFSWAGLLYLTLFLSSKFAIALPFLPPRPFSTNPAWTSAATRSNLRTFTDSSLRSSHRSTKPDSETSETPTLSDAAAFSGAVVPIRNQAAAPPVYTLVFALVPICAAIYICSTRFSDFRHFGFDLLFGSFIGISCAWFSFRWYHLPIRQGAGWSWGPRSRERAWGLGIGRESYVGVEGWRSKGKSVDRGFKGGLSAGPEVGNGDSEGEAVRERVVRGDEAV